MPDQSTDFEGGEVPIDNRKRSIYPVVVFDGVCNLCNKSVQFIIRNDDRNIFHFSPLQSESSRQLLELHKTLLPVDFDPDQADSFLLITPDGIKMMSDAWLDILSALNGYKTIATLLRLIPGSIRDYVYRVIGKNRYRWFGKMNSCMVPDPEINDRFL